MNGEAMASMPGPQRKAARKTHLDASVVPVEQALLGRAAELEQSAAQPAALGDSPAEALFIVRVREQVAAEFRALAEELHWR